MSMMLMRVIIDYSLERKYMVIEGRYCEMGFLKRTIIVEEKVMCEMRGEEREGSHLDFRETREKRTKWYVQEQTMLR